MLRLRDQVGRKRNCVRQDRIIKRQIYGQSGSFVIKHNICKRAIYGQINPVIDNLGKQGRLPFIQKLPQKILNNSFNFDDNQCMFQRYSTNMINNSGNNILCANKKKSGNNVVFMNNFSRNRNGNIDPHFKRFFNTNPYNMHNKPSNSDKNIHKLFEHLKRLFSKRGIKDKPRNMNEVEERQSQFAKINVSNNKPDNNSNSNPSSNSDSENKIDNDSSENIEMNDKVDPISPNIVNNLQQKSKPDQYIRINREATEKIRQSQQEMAREQEVDPFSFGGIAVLIVGALLFYWLYSVDNKKHTEIGGILTKLTKSKTLDFYINQNEKYPIKKCEDHWNAFQVITDHLINFVNPNSYNSESIISKLFRLFHIPNQKLLPNVKAQYSPRVLVVDIDTICHSSWSRADEHERNIRPGYNEFLQKMAMCGWEIVLWGNYEEFDWQESPDFIKLDGKGFVQHYLWNNDSYYFRGHRCKDITRLNRDLKRIIVIDSDPRNVQLNPENAIILPKWNSKNKNDDELSRYTLFLEYLNRADVDDIRNVLKAYKGYDIPKEFENRYYEMLKRNLRNDINNDIINDDQIEGYNDNNDNN